jgi:hypothetical protein
MKHAQPRSNIEVPEQHLKKLHNTTIKIIAANQNNIYNNILVNKYKIEQQKTIHDKYRKYKGKQILIHRLNT